FSLPSAGRIRPFRSTGCGRALPSTKLSSAGGEPNRVLIVPRGRACVFRGGLGESPWFGLQPLEAKALVRVSVVFGQAPKADGHRLCRSLLTVYLSIRLDNAAAPVYR